MMRMLLGHVSVRVWNSKDRQELKLEYNNFKSYCAAAEVLLALFHVKNLHLFVITHT